MRAETLHPSRISLVSRLLLAVAAVFAISGEIQASTLSAAEPFDAVSHAEVCKCGPKCRGASCCCGSRTPKSATKPKTQLSPRSTIDLAETPCLNSAPCSDPLLPTSAPAGSFGKVAALGSLEPPTARVGRRMPAVPSSRLSLDRRAFRLDRPPKAFSHA